MPPAVDQEGLWGHPTSTLDWCEENYVVTTYIAEFWNTISNVVMIIPPVLSGFYCWKIGTELRFIFLNVALFIVGIGSWLFHMTLKYEMQLLDELPMIYGTAMLVYILHHTSNSKSESLIDIVIPVSYCVTASVVYIALRSPILHQTFYGCLVFLLILKTVQTCRLQPAIKPYALASFALYLVGFVLWNVDNIYCSYVRHARQQTMPSLQPITQLHAWWHLFSGIASSMQIVFALYARSLDRKQACSVNMLGCCWPYLSYKKRVP